MRFLLLAIVIVFSPASFAEPMAYLCGDPPPVDSSSLKGELNGKASFLSRFIGDAELKGKIETSREDVFSKYPNADKLVVDHYLLFQTCVIIMNDTSLDTSQKLEELRKTRREFKDVSVSQRIAATCRHKDFGLEHWGSQETITQSSGWMSGGSNPTNWCNQLTRSIIQGRSIGPIHKATVLNKGEEAKWTGTFGRTREYNYYCTVKMEWNPVYKEKQDASRCGTL
ncbi:TPA: hypothetical protein ACN36H_003142 [Vibrio parahaemolyticus]